MCWPGDGWVGSCHSRMWGCGFAVAGVHLLVDEAGSKARAGSLVGLGPRAFWGWCLPTGRQSWVLGSQVYCLLIGVWCWLLGLLVGRAMSVAAVVLGVLKQPVCWGWGWVLRLIS